MSVDLGALVRDLQAEHDDLICAIRASGRDPWDVPTPAEGWTVRDQLAHLAHFDEVAVLAITGPARFATLRASVIDDIQGYVDAMVTEGRTRPAEGMIGWADDARAALVAALASADPATRVPWFGPDMTVASKATARIMETWAHGQDIVDGLGVERPPTARLRHVAHIGARAMPNSFRTHGLPVPNDPVRIELAAPDDSVWTWGDDGAADVVRGSALDFCLVVTQRRHPDDTDLSMEGPVAQQWITIAQAFAGPAGTGRAPGQFPRTRR
jgi:uncharacterized protein (TIGR03084 family)